MATKRGHDDNQPELELGLPELVTDVHSEKPPAAVQLTGRGAFVSAMSPGYFGLSDEMLEDVPEEAYRQSHPAVLLGELYRDSSQSLRQHRRQGRWVLLSAAEFNAITNVPERYANGVEARNRSLLPASYREQGDRVETSVRSGAHALELPVDRMNNLLTVYRSRIDMLHGLVEMIPHHWHANSTKKDVRLKTVTARDGFHGLLQDIADVGDWSKEDLEEAKRGLDRRLVYGHGQRRLEEKKAAWLKLSRVMGNHTIDKKVLVRDRLERSQAEIERRLDTGKKPA